MTVKIASNSRSTSSLQLSKSCANFIHRRRIRAQLSSFSGCAIRLERKAQQ